MNAYLILEEIEKDFDQAKTLSEQYFHIIPRDKLDVLDSSEKITKEVHILASLINVTKVTPICKRILKRLNQNYLDFACSHLNCNV